MAGLIPQAFIDELLARTDLLSLVGETVRLRKTGRSHVGLCPFHKEKSPSFSVNPDRQFYYCFGCHASGTAITWLMEHDRLEFPEAIADLASRLGLSIPREAEVAETGAGLSARIHARNAEALKYFSTQLRNHPEAPEAVAYLKGRGVSGVMARDFALGFAPSGWEGLSRSLGTDAEARSELLAAGLVIQRDDGGQYDRFRSRIMFPIRDSRGRVLGFGGRILGSGEPKYLNSPETPVFHKGRELYGLHEARSAGPADTWIMVEGYMDVIALAQHGVRHVVATLGTATTREHLERMFRLTGEVVFCFDGDPAGRRAAWRALEVALPLLGDRHYVSFLFLPPQDDPDTLVRREGPAAFQQPERRVPLSNFLFEHLSSGLNLAQVDEDRARLVDLARPLLEQLPNGAYRRILYGRLAELCRLDLPEARVTVPSAPRPHQALEPGRRTRMAQTRCRQLLKLLLGHPQLGAEVEGPGEFEHLSDPWAPMLSRVVALLHEHPELAPVALLPLIDDVEQRQALAGLMHEELLLGAEESARDFRALLSKTRERARKPTREEQLAAAEEALQRARSGNHDP